MTPADLDALWDFSDPAASERRFRQYYRDHPEGRLRGEALTQMARALGLQRKFEEAFEVLLAVDASSVAQDPRVHVRVVLERGRVMNSSGRAAEARPLFEEAWALAREAGLDALAVDAAHMVAIATEGDEQLSWNEQAIAFAQSSSDAGARKWLASLYNNTGWTYHDREQYQRALELFTLAQELRASRGEVENGRVARWCVARCLRSLGRYDEALAMQQALLAENPDGDGYCEEELGELLLALGRSEEALPFFAAAHAKLSKDPWFVDKEPERLARMDALAAG